MTKLTDRQEDGIAFITGVMGDAFGAGFRAAAESPGFGSAITRMAADFAFAEAWQNPALARRDKSIAVISALIGSGNHAELRNHVKIGVANGLTVAELEGILIQLTPYVGFAGIAGAMTATVAALREIGIAPDEAKTSEERGLI